MQFQVPQFIEVEDKLVGPLTFIQFVYLLGGGGASYIIWALVSPFSTLIAVILITPIVGIALALAFYKVNNRPFIVTLEYGLRYFLTDKLYIWSKRPEASPTPAALPAVPKKLAVTVPKLSESKLKDLAWSLDIAEKMKH